MLQLECFATLQLPRGDLAPRRCANPKCSTRPTPTQLPPLHCSREGGDFTVPKPRDGLSRSDFARRLVMLTCVRRLFSVSRPPSVRRRLASAALSLYAILACLVLCLVERWTAIEAAYFATATLTTVRREPPAGAALARCR